LRPQFGGRDLDHLSIAPDVDGQALPSVLDKHFLHSSFERHFGALFQRQVQNVCGGLCHRFPAGQSRVVVFPLFGINFNAHMFPSVGDFLERPNMIGRPLLQSFVP
jgi:hypothetical protein